MRRRIKSLLIATCVIAAASLVAHAQTQKKVRQPEAQTATLAQPKPWTQDPYKTMLVEVTSMNRAKLESARRSVRSQSLPRGEQARHDFFVRAAYLHLTPKTAKTVGLNPKEIKLYALPGEPPTGTAYKALPSPEQKSVADWGMNAACFVAMWPGLGCATSGCYCHCATIAKKTLPVCKTQCGLKTVVDVAQYVNP